MTTNIVGESGPASAAGNVLFGGDLRVARMGYGAMRLPGWPIGKPVAREQAHAVLRRAVELGVNHIDTSYFYGSAGVLANDLIREALHPYPENLVIVTKVAPILEGDDIHKDPQDRIGFTPEGLRTAVEANLRTLGLDRLDAVNLRVGGDTGPEEGSLAEPLSVLAALRDEGLIRHIGVSNVTAAQLAEARSITDIACVQNLYNILHRADDAIVDTCAEAGIAFVPFFPVGGFQPIQAQRIAAVAERHGATVPQTALAWLLARSPSILLIPGTGSVAHLEENVAAASLKLTEEDLAELAG